MSQNNAFWGVFREAGTTKMLLQTKNINIKRGWLKCFSKLARGDIQQVNLHLEYFYRLKTGFLENTHLSNIHRILRNGKGPEKATKMMNGIDRLFYTQPGKSDIVPVKN